MKDLQDIANLISLRGFLVLSIDNLHMKLSRDDIKSIQTKIQLFDKTIIEQTLKLDLLQLGKKEPSRSFSVESTEDVKVVADRLASFGFIKTGEEDKKV